MPLLARAAAIVRQAQSLVTDELDDTEPAQRIRRALASLETAEHAARSEAADQRMIVQLEEARWKQTGLKDFHFDLVAGEPIYAAAFKDYGVDVQLLDPAASGKLIAGRAIRNELAVALLNWAMIRRGTYDLQDKLFIRLIDIAQMVDPATWNQQFRASLKKGD